jgi:hypothetical protein
MSRRDRDATRANGAPGGNSSAPRVIGLDGWPIDGPSNAEIAQDAEKRYQEEMKAALERLHGGGDMTGERLTAYAEAIRLFWKQHPEQFPYELVEESEAVVEAALVETEKRARREFRIALTRWEEVTDLHGRWPELNRTAKANLKRAKELIASKATTAQERKRLQAMLPELMEAANDDRGRTIEDACEAVFEASKKHETARTGRAVRHSYELIKAAGGERATFESFLIVRRERGPG